MASDPEFANFLAQQDNADNFLTTYYAPYPTHAQTQAPEQSVENSASATPLQQLDWDLQDLKAFKATFEPEFKDFKAMRRLEPDIKTLQAEVEAQAELLARMKTHQQQTTKFLFEFRTQVLDAVNLGANGQKDMISPPVWERELHPAQRADGN